ncbi:NAD-dependent epimerase/dehydratase family protein [Vibrio coralliirubri]|uniref:NAD-dependent epimerase/dehydratase family protein n=1 Tax=Vibrio coralliirubri TaxID=1516159 RepID=UPI0006324D83|nr:NAD-dependent epimerase/dehydratase family protein [Vibrio coralliirubri]CDS95279.1 putative dTDP-4-dehydrorhamnose reductase [Vibrio coralliirubri]
MKVLILGSKGMLGSICSYYLKENNVDVVEFNERFQRENTSEYIKDIKSYSPDIIINCIGKIPQKESSASDYITSNILLPKALSEANLSCIIIHASTDCVFEPNSERTGSNDFTNAVDDYGCSKAIGDKVILVNPMSYVIRASIIGITKGNYSSGLLDWFVSNENEVVDGYTDHYWNGITTLSWIKFVYKTFISTDEYKNIPKLIHLGSDSPVSKYDILSYANDIFRLNRNLLKKNTLSPCDRTLKVDIFCGSVRQQIVDLKEQFSE